MKYELQRREEAHKTNTYLDSLRARVKKVPNLKTPDHDGIN